MEVTSFGDDLDRDTFPCRGFLVDDLLPPLSAPNLEDDMEKPLGLLVPSCDRWLDDDACLRGSLFDTPFETSPGSDSNISFVDTSLLSINSESSAVAAPFCRWSPGVCRGSESCLWCSLRLRVRLSGVSFLMSLTVLGGGAVNWR